MKIVIFTSNSSGGIPQLVYTLADTLETMGHEVVTFFPIGCEVKTNHSIYYKYSNSINISSSVYKQLSKKMLGIDPNLVLMADDAVTASSVAYWTSRKVKTMLCIHDVAPHTTKNVIRSIKRLIKMHSIIKAYKSVQGVVCFSDNEMNKLKNLYPICYPKSHLLKLGAHLVTADSERPKELDVDNYALFFGRIDYYKGVDILLQEYIEHSRKINFNLVVAGKGPIDSELERISLQQGVRIINRFITNEEMNYLIEHAKTVVLPYRDASQSGVLPISYHYGVPVVVSNLPGLTAGVKDYETGRVFRDSKELIGCINWTIDNYDLLADNIKLFYEREYNWSNNIKALISNIEET